MLSSLCANEVGLAIIGSEIF